MASTQENQLQDVIEAIRTCRIDVVDRTKNQVTRLLLGITTLEQEDIVRNLSVSDFHQGPLEDRDTLRGGQLWVFKTSAHGRTIYVKVKLIEFEEGQKVVRALSCHIDYM